MNRVGPPAARQLGHQGQVPDHPQFEDLPRNLRRLVRQIVKDSLRWAGKLTLRLDRPDEALQDDLAVEAAAFGAGESIIADLPGICRILD